MDSQLHNAGLQVELGTYSEMQRKDYRLHLQSMTVQVESICGEKHTLNETENLDDISDPMSLTALLRHCWGLKGFFSLSLFPFPVCKFVSIEMKSAFEETGKTKEVIDTKYRFIDSKGASPIKYVKS